MDQVGYLPGSMKLAFVTGSGDATIFVIHEATTGAIRFRGALSAPTIDRDSGDSIRAADFSSVTKPGVYFLDVPGVGTSWSFQIEPDLYRPIYYLAMRSFYGQRCGTAVNMGPEFPSLKHPICHTAAAFHSSSGKEGTVPPSKGWHDAGDYGRYVVNSGISTATLLWTWEIFGDRVKDVSLSLPDHKRTVPDLLTEVRWNLDWMLTMQDTDGGVWHKQTSEGFAGFVMPDQDKQTSFIIGTGKQPFKSTCATADLAAVAAIGARVYRPFDPTYAERLGAAAGKAWTWAAANPGVTFRNPPGVVTGEYGDGDCHDELFWAAAELARTTHDATYEQYFLGHYQDYLHAGRRLAWSFVAPMALWTYALGNGPNRIAVDEIRRQTLASATELAERATQGYRLSLRTSDYDWGSNGEVANYGLELLIANRFQPSRQFVYAALDNLHYLLGRNTFSLSFVTRVGEHSVLHPHHRPSGAPGADLPWPGLLSGGPNRGRQDAAMRRLVPAGTAPARSYIDNQEAFACNEVAINWNAPFVFLLAGLNGLP